MTEQEIALKCGCSIAATPEGPKWILGKECTEKNCGECRTIMSIHPFTRKRFTDIIFHLA